MHDGVWPKGLQRTSLTVADGCHEWRWRCARSERNANGVDKWQEREWERWGVKKRPRLVMILTVIYYRHVPIYTTKHTAYLRRSCCTKSVGPCAPRVPAVRNMFRLWVGCQLHGWCALARRFAVMAVAVDCCYAVCQLSAIDPNVAGISTLYPQGSFNTDPRSDLWR